MALKDPAIYVLKPQREGGGKFCQCYYCSVKHLLLCRRFWFTENIQTELYICVNCFFFCGEKIICSNISFNFRAFRMWCVCVCTSRISL